MLSQCIFKKTVTQQVIVWMTVLFLLQGCASGRYIENRSTPPPDAGISSKDSNLEVTLNYVILPNGPGSWVKDARWDEYFITLRNLSNRPVTIEKVSLIDPRGVYIKSGLNPGQLTSESEMLAEGYKDLGMTVAIEAGGAALWLASGAAVGAMGAGALVLGPALLLAGPGYLLYSRYAKTKDLENIAKEFQRREISNLTLAGNATTQGSKFFPIVPNPRDLVVDYRMGSEIKTLDLSLEKLKGLHVASPENEKDKTTEKVK